MTAYETKTTTVPPELTHEIVTILVAEYVDNAIVGPFGLQSLPMPPPQEPYPDPPEWETMVARVLAEDVIDSVPNPIVPLFSVSFSMRETVLKVLSTVLSIPLVGDVARLKTLEAKPWTVLHAVRQCFANPHAIASDARQQALDYAARSPFLHTYTAIGQARVLSQQLWYRQRRLLLLRPGTDDWVTGGPALSRDMDNLHRAVLEIAEMPARVPRGALRSTVQAHVRGDVLRIHAFLVYKVPILVAKFAQDTIELVDRRRTLGYPAVHDTDRLLLYALRNVQQMEEEVLSQPPHAPFDVLFGALEQDDINFANGVMDAIYNYEPQPDNATEYNKCKDIAQTFREKIAPHLVAATDSGAGA